MRPQLSQTQLNSDQISDHIINRILGSGKITAADRAWFLNAAFSDMALNAQQLTQVRQVADRLKMGLLKVVD